MIRIIGIGSPFGDDAVGLEVARILAEAPPPDCEVIAADRPGATLLELLDGAEAAILVDAVQSGNAPGLIHEFDLTSSIARMLIYSPRTISAWLRRFNSLASSTVRRPAAESSGSKWQGESLCNPRV